MIQQSSMPPVSANVLAALVGSLQLPPAMIIPATGTAAPVAVQASFPSLPLQSAQAFSGVLVDQLAAAIARAGSIPTAGGTAPPQAASPPLWAATAPSGLADAGVSPGQQVVDQTGTSAGGVRSASALLISQLPARVASSLPSVAVSVAPAANGFSVPAPRELPGGAPAGRAPAAGSPRAVPVTEPAPVAASGALAGAPESIVARAAITPPVLGPAPRDQAAERVQAIVATLAGADPGNPPSIESLRTTLLSALGTIDPGRSAEAARVVRGLAAAAGPAGSAPVAPRTDAGSPLAAIAAVIRAANPAELVAIVRRAETWAVSPAAGAAARTAQGPAAVAVASAASQGLSSPAAPTRITTGPATFSVAPLEAPVIAFAADTVAANEPSIAAVPGPAAANAQRVRFAPAPAVSTGGSQGAQPAAAPTFAALRNLSLAISGPAPRPAPATLPAVPPAPDMVLAAAVHAYDATQPDAAPAPFTGLVAEPVPAAGFAVVNPAAASGEAAGVGSAFGPRMAPAAPRAQAVPSPLFTDEGPALPTAPAVTVAAVHPERIEPAQAGPARIAPAGPFETPAPTPQAPAGHPGTPQLAAVFGPHPAVAAEDLAISSALAAEPPQPAAAAVLPAPQGDGEPAALSLPASTAAQPVPANVAGTTASLLPGARGPVLHSDASTAEPMAGQVAAGPAVEPASLSPVGGPAIQPAVVAPAQAVDLPQAAAASPAVPVLIAAPVAAPQGSPQAGITQELATPESGAGTVSRTGAGDPLAAGRPVVPAGPGAVTQPAAVASAGGLTPDGRGGLQPEVAERNQRAGAAATPLTAASVPAGTPAVATPAGSDGGRGAAVAAAMAQVAQESGQTRPGTVRNVDLRLATNDLGAVRVRLSVDHAGAVRIEVRAATEQAAQALRSGFPQLADALAARNLALSSAAVQVMSGAEFGGSNQPRQQPRWYERARKPGPGAADAGEPVLAGIGAAAYGRRAAAGVDVFA